MKVLSAKAILFNKVVVPGITHQDLIDYVEHLTGWFPTSVVSTIKHMLQNTYKSSLEYNLIWLQIYLYIYCIEWQKVCIFYQ
jgi:hypothetical protein